MAQPKPIADYERVLLNQLKAPFDARLVKWRTGGGGKQLAYIDARDVMKRLDEVLGAGHYQTRYTRVDGGFVCELTLKIGSEWITRSDGANDTKVEPLKGGISSALKRAANAWGIGRYLYYLDPNKFNSGNTHQWPKWALPGDVENWEDIAELENATFGMDEEYAGVIIASVDRIRAATTREELMEIYDAMDAEEQLAMAGEFSKRTKEVVLLDVPTPKVKKVTKKTEK